MNARGTAQRNGGDGGRITRKSVTACLSSARARKDERMTCAKDRKHASCRVRPRRWRGRRGRKPAYMYSAKKAHPQDDAMGYTRAHGASHIGVKLRSASIESRVEHVKRGSAHRRGGVEHRSVSHRRGGRRWRGRVSVVTRVQKSTRMQQPNAVMVGGRTQARRGSLIC
jgi:hypothetical protein